MGEERDLQKLPFVPYDAFRPEFKEKADFLTRKVFSSVGPKRGVDGTHINGLMFVELVEQYCQLLNASASVVPNMNVAWADVVGRQLRRIQSRAVAAYRTRMNTLLARMLDDLEFIEEPTLMAEHAQIKSEALAEFTKQTLVGAGDGRLRRYQDDADDKIAQLLAHVVAKNADVGEMLCEQKSAELCDAVVENISRSPDAYVQED